MVARPDLQGNNIQMSYMHTNHFYLIPKQFNLISTNHLLASLQFKESIHSNPKSKPEAVIHLPESIVIMLDFRVGAGHFVENSSSSSDHSSAHDPHKNMVVVEWMHAAASEASALMAECILNWR